MASARLFAPPRLLLGLGLLLPFSFIPGVCSQRVKVLQSPESVSVTAGEQATLTCTLTYIGTFVNGPVRWYKRSGEEAPKLIYSDIKAEGPPPRISRLSPDSNTDISITIRNISTQDTGTYYCVKFQKDIDGNEKEHNKSDTGSTLSVRGTTPSPAAMDQFLYYVIAACLCLLLKPVLAIVIFMRTKKKRGTGRQRCHLCRPRVSAKTSKSTLRRRSE